MKLSVREKLSYGIGAVGKDMVYMLSATYVLYYYEDILKISAIFTGIILLIARVFDALNDPLMGVFVAKTRTRWGKFRPWLFTGTVLNAFVLYAMFAAPADATGTALLVYASAAYILWGVTYTMMDIPYWSMIPAITESGKDRESLSTFAKACAGVGSAIIMIVTMKAVYSLGGGNEREGFKWFALIIAALFIGSAIVTCFNIKEKSTLNMETASIKKMFTALIQNDQAIAVVITIVLVNCSIYITSNIVIYFFKYDIGGDAWYNSYTLFNTFGGAMQILAIMLFYPLARRFLTSLQVFKGSILLAIAGFSIFLLISFLNLTSVFVFFIPALCIFSANGMLSILTTLYLSNSVDYGELRNGRREESVILSMQTFVVKLASGISVLLSSIALEIFHISKDESAETVISTQSRLGLRLTMTILPMIGLVAALLFFSKRFTLSDEKMTEISDALKESRKVNAK